MKPIVTIIGRPNVGKSALFNRLVGRRQALVDSTPGLTRDRLYGDVTWRGVEFQLVDTGGLHLTSKDRVTEQIASQAVRAMEESSLALFVVDSRDGPVPLDRQVSDWTRRWGKPVLLVANKADTERDFAAIHEFSELGIGPARPVSALHGKGIGELLDAVVENLRSNPTSVPGTLETGLGSPVRYQVPSRYRSEMEVPPPAGRTLRVAFVGRPNVGKSSLLNRILGHERVLVDEVPGTTRDPVEAKFSHRDRTYHLVDTAGLRSKRTLKSRVDAVARLKALEALREAEVCVGVLDASLGIVRDDLKLLDEVLSAGRPMVLAVNKWDLLPRTTDPKTVEQAIARRAPFIRFAPVIGVSAKTGFHILPLLDKVAQVAEEAGKKLTSQQRKNLLDLIRQDPRAPSGVRHAQLIYLTQVSVTPPLFQLMARMSAPFRESDLAYLEQVFRREHGFTGVPVRFRILQKRRGDREEAGGRGIRGVTRAKRGGGDRRGKRSRGRVRRR